MFPFHSQEDVYYNALGLSSWAQGQKTSINNWVKFHNFEDKKKKSQPKEKTKISKAAE